MGRKACITCNKARTKEDFSLGLHGKKSSGKRCRDCYLIHRNAKEKIKREANKEQILIKEQQYREANREKVNRGYRERRAKMTPEERKARNKKVYEMNKDKIRARARDFNRANPGLIYSRSKGKYKKRKPKPISQERAILQRVKNGIRQITLGKKAQRSLAYTGCSSVEEFITKLSEKSDNPNWIKDKYHIDHVLQIHWFREHLEKNPDDKELISRLISHHSNLRPLSKRDNLYRSFVDVSCFKDMESFLAIEKFLNQKIRNLAALFLQNRHLFSGEIIVRLSDEEGILLRLGGYLIDSAYL